MKKVYIANSNNQPDTWSYEETPLCGAKSISISRLENDNLLIEVEK